MKHLHELSTALYIAGQWLGPGTVAPGTGWIPRPDS